MIRNNQTYYYHADGLGSIIAITDSLGRVVQRYDYNSFGQITYIQDPNFLQPYTYTSREYDEETGLYYFRARYYDARVGRFITQDPIGLAGGDVNLYSYVGNNPIKFIDPFGLLNIIGGVGGSAVGITGIEGSAGFVINTSGGLNNVGFTGSFGVGGGVNISGDVYGGIITGDIKNVSGKTYNINVVGGPLSVTIFTDAQGNVIGFTIGYGPGVPIGASGTQSITGVLTLQDILDFIRNKFKPKPCPD
jgi:RHS repeat-associated protein